MPEISAPSDEGASQGCGGSGGCHGGGGQLWTSSGGDPGTGIEGFGPDAGLPGPEFPVPSLPVPPKPGPVVLPPLNAPRTPQATPGESHMTLMSPASLNEGDGTDWAVVIGIALVAEIALLWFAACVGLWRRRIALARAGRGTA